MAVARQRSKKRLPSSLQFQNIEFISVSNTPPIQLEGTSFDYSNITCQIAYLLQDGTKNLYEIEVGTQEIIESVAFELEEMLVLKFGSDPQAPPVDPYGRAVYAIEPPSMRATFPAKPLCSSASANAQHFK